MRVRTVVDVGLIGLAGLVGAACSSDDGSVVTGATTTVSSTAHNQADVTFAQGMIPHHQQAVEMAKLASGRASDPRVLDLASRIQAAQDPEIDEMTGWLEDWKESVPSAMGSGAMGGMTDPGSTMSTEDMAGLTAASGAEFDTMFLAMMVTHHQSAVQMATTEVRDGRFAAAVALAKRIISAQKAEITEMQRILMESARSTTTMAAG